MEDIKVAKYQLEVCFRSNLGFKEEVPRILRIIKQSSESYIQFFFKTITEVLTSSQATPSTKFYALLTLLKASEAKNYSFYHFLVKECDLLNYIYYCGKYDLNPKSVSPNKGTHYFSKHPSTTEMVLGFNVVRLCQEIIVDWNHLCKEFKPRNYFGIFKFLLGRIRKATHVKKPFFFIDKNFDLRKDLSTCNFQTQRPYISRQSSRNLLKVPNLVAQVPKNNNEVQVDSDDSADMSMEDDEGADELIFTRSVSYSRLSSQEGRGSFLDQLRNETLQDIQKLHSNQDSENPEPVGEEEVESIANEGETEYAEPVEQVEQVPETSALQTATEEEEADPTPFDLSKVALRKITSYSRYNSGGSTVALSQQEDNIEEQKGEDIGQETKINGQKRLLVRTQPATPDKLLTLSFFGRGNSGEGKKLGGVASRDLESDLMKIKDRITKSQTNTPEKKGCAFDFDPIKTHTELDAQSQDNVVRPRVNLGRHHKGVQSLQKTVRPPAILIHTLKEDFELNTSWNFESSSVLEASRETGFVSQVSNMSGHSEGGLTKSIHRRIRSPQIGGKTHSIIVFADQE